MSTQRQASLCPEGLIALLRAIVRLIFRPTYQGEIYYRSQRYAFPLPRRSIQFEADEGYATYLTYGDPELERFFADSACSFGWTFVERLGQGYTLNADGLRLIVVSRECGEFLILLEFLLAENKNVWSLAR